MRSLKRQEKDDVFIYLLIRDNLLTSTPNKSEAFTPAPPHRRLFPIPVRKANQYLGTSSQPVYELVTMHNPSLVQPRQQSRET
jgi:hypothetical protein